MSRPRLLDLFAGAGGAAMGYHRAGFDVVGVDINPQPHYPFEFHQADALEFPLDGYDAIHASPPCQDHSALAVMHPTRGTGWMLDATIKRLRDCGRPWVVENVVGPTVRMDGWWFVLCGSQFGLEVRRHRRFGSNFLMLPNGCRHDLQPLPVDVTGHSEQGRVYRARKALGLPPVGIVEKREAMGIDWMNRDELAQAIPPAYTQWIGEQLIDHLAQVAS